MLAQTSHIQWNNLILSESLRNSFFFPHNLKLSAYLKRKQSYNVLTWPPKNVLFIFAEIASKQTHFTQKWDHYMNDDCYQRNVLSLSYNYLY